MPEAVDWTAFYVGLGGGGNFVFVESEADAAYLSSSSSTTGTPPITNITTNSGAAKLFSDLGKAGVFGTAEIGADYQMESIVFGVLANYDFGKTKINSDSEFTATRTTTNPVSNTTSTGNFDTTVEVGDSWAVGGRIGFLPTESTLAYVLGGYTEAKISQSAEISSTTGPTAEASGSEWNSGYFVGGGVETLLTDSISLKGEYRFADYGKVSSSFADTVPPATSSVNQSSDVTVHSVRAVLSFRF